MAENVRIAVVDDENSVRESFQQILSIKNYDITLYEKASDFLNSFKADMYDVIFLDLVYQNDIAPYNNMKDKNGGIEALKKIKEIDKDSEVIIVTGYAQETTHLNAITMGAMEYLSKPFMMENIYELVNRAMQRRRNKKTRGKPKGPVGPIH